MQGGRVRVRYAIGRGGVVQAGMSIYSSRSYSRDRRWEISSSKCCRNLSTQYPRRSWLLRITADAQLLVASKLATLSLAWTDLLSSTNCKIMAYKNYTSDRDKTLLQQQYSSDTLLYILQKMSRVSLHRYCLMAKTRGFATCTALQDVFVCCQWYGRPEN